MPNKTINERTTCWTAFKTLGFADQAAHYCRRYNIKSRPFMRSIFFTLLLLPAISNASNTAPLYSCERLYTKNACASISNDPLEKIELCAENGDMESQNVLAGLYYQGSQEIAADHKKAVYYLKLSANQGCSESQRLLGHMYYYGHGTAPSLKQAIYWFEKAAELKEPYAMCQLGTMHARAEHPSFDRVRGFKYYKEAYDLYGMCTEELGASYVFGMGTNKNKALAKIVLEEPANKGSKKAIELLNLLHQQ